VHMQLPSRAVRRPSPRPATGCTRRQASPRRASSRRARRAMSPTSPRWATRSCFMIKTSPTPTWTRTACTPAARLLRASSGMPSSGSTESRSDVSSHALNTPA